MTKLSAVIIDTRGGQAFVYVVNNIIVNLPEATVVWFHGPNTDVKESLKGVIDARRIRLSQMQFDPPFTLGTYNSLVTQEAFYKDLHENILVFQPDSCFESLSLHALKEFEEFDYVGAPWEGHPGWNWNNSVGNGGFCFRKKSAMIKCIRERPYRGQFHEDVYFGWYCKDLINVAPVEVAKRFSYEIHKNYNGAAGFHKIWAYMKPTTRVTRELFTIQ